MLHASVGDTGCAMSLMSLVAALEQAESGEKILLASYGNGCDAAILETTDRIGSVPACRGIREAPRRPSACCTNYKQYLRWRELVPIQPAARPPLEERMPSPAAQWREVPWEMRLTGTRCLHCGTPQYPPQRVCVKCHTKDEMEPYRFTDVPAKVFSFSHDYVMETARPAGHRDLRGLRGRRPHHVRHDRPRRRTTVEVGMPLEMTFRRLYYVNGIYNYWWKCQPVRCRPTGTEE